MVALNWQYLNAATMLNYAMFTGTGGWVLKPEGYRSNHHSSTKEEALDRGTLDLSIELLAGQGIGPEREHQKLYMRCELHVEGAEQESDDLTDADQSQEGQIKARTEPVRCYNAPDFQRQAVHFHAVPDVAEELTFVRYVDFFRLVQGVR